MLPVGSIVRGNWSSIEYEVVRCDSCDTHWWVYCKNKASFNYLGARKRDEILVTDPTRPNDRVIVVREPNSNNQLLLPL